MHWLDLCWEEQGKKEQEKLWGENWRRGKGEKQKRGACKKEEIRGASARPWADVMPEAACAKREMSKRQILEKSLLMELQHPQ